ncbi:hypothetical protein P9209_18135 [Prescottella defluvii]|nr:hypothetical protein P9209_18135 [Prescottella defluvii]
MGNTDGTATRLSNTVEALSARLAALPESSDVGLWVYSRGLDGSKPYVVKVPTGPLSDGDRRQRIVKALQSLRPATATSTYASVIAAHRARSTVSSTADPTRSCSSPTDPTTTPPPPHDN